MHSTLQGIRFGCGICQDLPEPCEECKIKTDLMLIEQYCETPQFKYSKIEIFSFWLIVLIILTDIYIVFEMYRELK